MDKPRMMTLKDPQQDPPRAMPRSTWRPPHEAIAKRAYEIFEDSGRPHGRDVEFWLQAERELIQMR